MKSKFVTGSMVCMYLAAIVLANISSAHFGPGASIYNAFFARNHNRPQNTARKMADRWDSLQPPPRWHQTAEQMEIAA